MTLQKRIKNHRLFIRLYGTFHGKSAPFSVSGLIISGASGKRKEKMSAYRVPEKMPAYRVPILKSYFYRTGAYQIGHHQEGDLSYCREENKGAKKDRAQKSPA